MSILASAERVPAERERHYRVATGTRASTIAGLLAALVLAGLAALPLLAGRGLVQDLFTVFTMLALAQYWNLLAGFAGLVSVGQQAYVGLGAYLLFGLTAAAGLDPVLAILLAGVGAVVVAVPTAFVVFRLRSAYFAIGTWVVAEVFRLVLAQVKSLGGGTGMSLPREVTNDSALVRLTAELLGLRTAAARDVASYWLALALAAGTIAFVYAVLRSRRGLALAAIRDSETAALSVGVDAFRLKLQVYLVAAFGTGLTGALIYFQKARISPDAAFSVLDWTAYVLFIVVIGGLGSIEGPIVGVAVFYLLQDQLAGFGSWYLMLLGLIAILVMRFFPKGLWGSIAHRFDLSLFPIRRHLVPRDGTATHPLSSQGGDHD
ncbi:branched-chain amino acid ABC transporter permease [Labrys wisconsinensis]|uniref:Branched-chain amino acid transport system permease protein n=1 Tax=Labrys wisconsinensis TaxID=425677 RepID=A0ABU0JHZ2_9HYPH|nr:branched-chain amino acid ABC transporter permease [Labrys wisconsinensis]MDQ0473906.1 branched-chain amino acid transport system permease protein [Labrys wisconsinensis]